MPKKKKAIGLGDTIKKILSKIGITEERIKKLFGREDCGCDERKSFFNRIFPYKKK